MVSKEDIAEGLKVPYSAAVVIFLDRDSGKQAPTLLYPITRIELINMGNIKPVRVFIALDGKWVEQN